MGIVHIVLFEFKPETSYEAVKDTCQRMLALKEQCLHPGTGSPYIKSIIGGRDNSPEGMQGGITHAFVVEFENEADRAHYINADPAHLSFVQEALKVLARIQVVDFLPGVL